MRTNDELYHKSAFKKRCKTIGLWPEFVMAREELKRTAGFTPDDVLEILIPMFEERLDGLERRQAEGGCRAAEAGTR